MDASPAFRSRPGLSLAPQAQIGDAEREAGLRRLIYEAGYSSATAVVTSGVILTAFALHLGASNLIVGILASAPFLGQLLQAPAVLLIERLRRRKAIAVVTSAIGRSMLLLMTLAAFLPSPLAITALILGQFVLCGLGAIGGCAWNGWLRDLAPQERLGFIFARRTTWTTTVSLIAGLAAAFLLDRTQAGSDARALAFAGLYLVGCATGLISGGGGGENARACHAAADRRAARPRLDAASSARRSQFPAAGHVSLELAFAVNLATPFFTVFIVSRLGFDMTFVMLLSVASQVTNLIAVRGWGTLGDRFAHKSVLAVAAPTYILCIVGMIGASPLGASDVGMAYLVGLHALMGAAVAGVTLATANIALKLSPRGEATAYVATSALTSSLAAGIAPILGGLFADFFAARRFELLLRWTSPNGTVLLSPISLSHWDFYFLSAWLLGLYALHRLSLVQEEGQIDPKEMVEHIVGETRRAVRNLGTVTGLRALTDLPGALVHDARRRARWLRLQHHVARGSKPT
ncbi:MFS transporter [Sphingobium phenoxybenzoativorans]|uniref:MFS transporter n=1 Tax=Sphingobium phenoxybenzoativorans TaxID=1592790 RepID=UPI000872921F|nr:MFS transporter [Sphingobium phenoxybenzoativorans]